MPPGKPTLPSDVTIYDTEFVSRCSEYRDQQLAFWPLIRPSRTQSGSIGDNDARLYG